MQCHVTDLRRKQVINEKTGNRLGFVCDVAVDSCCGKVEALVIFGRGKCFGLLGHEEDIIIRWEDIRVIGEETIIVCVEEKPCGKQERREPGRSAGFVNFFR